MAKKKTVKVSKVKLEEVKGLILGEGEFLNELMSDEDVKAKIEGYIKENAPVQLTTWGKIVDIINSILPAILLILSKYLGVTYLKKKFKARKKGNV